MSYLVLARKWRPQTFRDLIGQEHVSQTLKNAIDSGRVAHAFLFTGARGVGKTSSARILAKALNCEHGPSPEPCNECPACVEITNGNAVDVFEIDGASNTSVDDVRELRENIKYLPSRCRFKIFIIDEVHMLSTSAFNALLKTLEEPPPHVKFIFATTEPHKVPITILSRCQRFDFRRIPLVTIVERLRHIVGEEGIAISDAALAMIARKGDGSMRDSLSTLDQVLAFCGEEVSDDAVIGLLGVIDRRLLLETSRAVFDKDCRGVLDIVKRVDAFGYNMRYFCQELLDHFRTLTLLRAVGEDADLPDLAAAEVTELQELSRDIDLSALQRHLTILLRAEGELSQTSFPRLVLEMALVKMATLAPVVPVLEILERLKTLEGKIGGAGLVASAQPAWEKKSPHQEKEKSPPPASQAARVTSAPAPQPSRTVDTAKSATAEVSREEGGGEKSWGGFVAVVRSKKRLLASLLEHGRPLVVGGPRLEIGFAVGSFELKQVQDPGTLADLAALAKAYFGNDVEVRVVPLGESAAAVPPSLAEKKSLERDRQQQELKERATGHPLVAAALEIFEGEIADIKENNKT
ncbi:MAG TPA: DNA polymerase III subunit gamma/tau [Geobacteraceae bacterium]